MTQACVAMSTVGGAVTASVFLGDYPRFGAQSVRYATAALLLVAVVRVTRRLTLRRPRGREWSWLIAAAAAGLSGYNLAVVQALDHAEPTVVATVVAGVPLVLAVAIAAMARRRVRLGVVGAAAVVVAGAAIVQGAGRANATGVALSVAALLGESAFTLLCLPVLARLGAASVATHTAWIAAIQLGVVAVIADGRGALPVPDRGVVLAVGYLVVASALAFVLWFLAVGSIGGDLAGLAAGVIPVAAVLTGLPLGVASIDARVVLGTALVAAGVVAGLRSARRHPPGGAPQPVTPVSLAGASDDAVHVPLSPAGRAVS